MPSASQAHSTHRSRFSFLDSAFSFLRWPLLLGMLAAAGGILIVELYFLLELYGFEYPYVIKLLGWEGIAVVAFVTAVALLFGWRAILAVRERNPLLPTMTLRLLFVLWLAALIWAADWVILTQRPVTHRLTAAETRADAAEPAELPAAIAERVHDPQRFKLILQRIAMNRPEEYAVANIVANVEYHAKQYGVDPGLLYFWLYLGSFYGEAPAGKVPFTSAMTGETIRDFVQVHLPSWFVESSTRRGLIVGSRLNEVNFLGHDGQDWRYALQKATYDASVEPFDTNVYTDVFLVMREFRGEFDEIFAHETTTLDRELGSAFHALESVFMREPYDRYDAPPWSAAQYDEYREPMKVFARSVFYKMVFDLDFGAKVQALVTKYYFEQYRVALGEARWDTLSQRQKNVLVAVLRDVYKPNIGRMSSNAYNLPEFNLAPYYYVLQLIGVEDTLHAAPAVWAPHDDGTLWGAVTKLRVFSEFLQVYEGAPLPGLLPTQTLTDSQQLIQRGW